MPAPIGPRPISAGAPLGSHASTMVAALALPIGGVALLPVVLADHLVDGRVLEIVEGLALSAIAVGLAVGCLASPLLVSASSARGVLAGAAIAAGASGLVCIGLPGSSVPNVGLVLMGLYAAAAPAILAVAAVGIGSNDTLRRSTAAIRTTGVLVAGVIGCAIGVLCLEGAEEALHLLLGASLILLMVGAAVAGGGHMGTPGKERRRSVTDAVRDPTASPMA